MAGESSVLRQVWLKLGMSGCKLFRVNTGKAWVSGAGPAVRRGSDVIVPAGRPVTLGFGLPNGDALQGASDLCGWTDVVITPEMVGRRVPVFTAIETKASGGGKRREAQINFIAQLHAAGGIAGFAASTEQAMEIVEAWRDGRAPDLM
jgi:hypothetical protein